MDQATIAENAGVAKFTATLSNASTQAVTVDLGFAGTATLTNDYTRTGTQIVIAAGSLSGFVTVTAVPDTVFEGGETVVVDITGVTNGTESGTQTATTTITDDDSAPTVTLAVDQATIAENAGVAKFTATLSNASTQAVTVDLGFAGTATLTNDYTRTGTQIVIAAGSLSGFVTVTAVPDTVFEGGETVVVDITGVTNGTESGTQTATTTIADDDSAPTVTLAVDQATIAENAGVAKFTATLSNASTQAVTVDLGFAGTATLTNDYTRTGTQIVIAAGSLSGFVTVTAVPDTVFEGGETVVVDITGVTNGTESGTQTATTTITDDDSAPTVTLAVDQATIAENAGVAKFTATLSNASTQAVTVDLGFAGTATLTNDYTRTGTQIVIAAGSLSGFVTVTAVPDTVFEGGETVVVDITGVTNGTESGTQTATTTITDDDSAPTVTLAVDQATIAENAGVAKFTATLSNASTQAVTVDLGFTGTATLTDDYTRTGTQIVIAAGSLSGFVTVTAVPDTVFEGGETVVVDITGVTNGTESGTQTATTTITDDDSAPTVTLAVDQATIAENAGVAKFTATLSNASTQAVTVDLGFAGTATLTDDYTRTGTQIVIAAGSLSGFVTVTAVPDTVFEGGETVVVDITGVTNGTESGTQTATTTITDDDSAPTVTLAVDQATIAENAGVAKFTATLSNASTQAVTVDLGFAGTATLTDDYTRTGTQIVIAAGSLSGFVTVTAVPDTVFEGGETVVVDITGVTNGTESGTQTATTTITDDDSAPTVTLAVDQATIAENAGVAKFTATLSNASTQAVTVDLGFAGTATLTNDYTRTGTQIVIAAGSLSGFVTVTAVPDTVFEGGETVVVDITGVTNGTESGTQTATTTITDDDSAPTVTLAVDQATIAENAGVAKFTATLSNASTQAVTVDLGFAGTATLTNDYTRTGTQIVIAAGSLSGFVTVTAVPDTVFEGGETVVVDITGVTNGTESGTQTATTTIADDDSAPTVTLAVDQATIAENAGVAKFTATLSNASTQAVTVDLGFAGTATLTNDYTRTGTQIVIAAGSLSGFVTVTAVPDTVFEGGETVVVDITGVTNGTESGTQTATTTITDDDSAPTVTLAVDQATIAENAGVAKFTATLSNASTQAVTVDLGFTGTATLTNDYTRTGTQIVIAAGSLSGFVTVTAVQDTVFEGGETVVVDITGVTNGTESGTQTATTTITDDDSAPTVTLAVDQATIAENAGVAKFTATLSNASTQAVTVDLGFAGTATLTDDYTRTGTQIVIAAGSLSGFVTVTAVQDTVFEGGETVVVDITGVTNGTEAGTQTATTTITDDDSAPTVTLAVDQATIAENAGVAKFTATLSNASTQAVTVDLGFAGTATLTDDYTRTGTQIVIAAGSLSGFVTVTAVPDTVFEGGETVVVDITGVTNGTESGTQTATTTIADDDGAPTVTLAVDQATIAENAGVAKFTATLSNASTQAVTVDLGFTGTATLTDDYTRTGTQIVIAAGSLSGFVTVTAVQDTVFEGGETVVVDITGVTNGTESGTQTATTTITDDDGAPTVTLAVDQATIAENAGVAKFTATLSNASTQAVTVDLGFTGTATLTDDYTRTGTQIVIAAGSLSGFVTVTAVQDTVFEGGETVVVDITGVTNGTESGTQRRRPRSQTTRYGSFGRIPFGPRMSLAKAI